MDGLVKAGKVTEAKTLFDEMKNKNVKTGMSSCHNVLLAAIF